MFELDTEDLRIIAEALDFTIIQYNEGIDDFPNPETAEDVAKTKEHIIKMEALLSMIQLALSTRE